MDGFQWVQQSDFSGGAFPLQERVPRTGVEDAVNLLVDDDGSIFKRGGGVYQGAAAAATLDALWDVELGGGQRTVARVPSLQGITVLASNDATWASSTSWVSGGGNTTTVGGRVAVVDGVMALPLRYNATGQVVLYGGGSPGGEYHTGTVSVSQGSRTVTGVGTSWVGNVAPGDIFNPGGGIVGASGFGVVQSVNSNTDITLAVPWIAPTLGAGTAYEFIGAPFIALQLAPTAMPVVGAAGNRLFVAEGDVIEFTDIGNPANVPAGNYHRIPGAVITGLQGVEGGLLVFSNEGIYRISNVEYDLTDALGNVQQSLSLLNQDIVLWHENGLAVSPAGVVVPAVDDIYIVGASLSVIGGGIRKLYRRYVAAGYTLGNATIVRGHYVLPVLNGAAWVDTLVCRLDTGAWGRMDGYSGQCVAFARRVTKDTTRTQRLFGVHSSRLVDCTGWFAPAAGNKSEADGSTHNLQVTLRTVNRSVVGETLRKTRVRYELDDAASDNPTLTAEVAVGRPGSAFTGLAGSAPENAGQAPHVWSKVNKKGSEFRMRLTSVGPSASLVLRSVEYAFRPTGRQ